MRWRDRLENDWDLVVAAVLVLLGLALIGGTLSGAEPHRFRGFTPDDQPAVVQPIDIKPVDTLPLQSLLESIAEAAVDTPAAPLAYFVVYTLPGCGPCKAMHDEIGDGDGEIRVIYIDGLPHESFTLAPTIVCLNNWKRRDGRQTMAQLRELAGLPAKPQAVPQAGPQRIAKRGPVLSGMDAIRNMLGDGGEVKVQWQRADSTKVVEWKLENGAAIEVTSPTTLTYELLDSDRVRVRLVPNIAVRTSIWGVPTTQRLCGLDVAGNRARLSLGGVPGWLSPSVVLE